MLIKICLQNSLIERCGYEMLAIGQLGSFLSGPGASLDALSGGKITKQIESGQDQLLPNLFSIKVDINDTKYVCALFLGHQPINFTTFSRIYSNTIIGYKNITDFAIAKRVRKYGTTLPGCSSGLRIDKYILSMLQGISLSVRQFRSERSTKARLEEIGLVDANSDVLDTVRNALNDQYKKKRLARTESCYILTDDCDFSKTGNFFDMEQTDSLLPQDLMKRLDVFISYRRGTDAAVARLIKMYLDAKGYKVFLDVDNMEGGHFDEQILDKIDTCNTLIAILSSDAFSNRNDSMDWFQKEIERALKGNKRIIPVIISEIAAGSSNIPDIIFELQRHNGIHYSHEYFGAMMERLEDMLDSPIV